VPAKAAPEQIVARLEWISARPQPSGPPKRRGPAIPAWSDWRPEVRPVS
jgi:hypothetical protein